MKLLNQHEKRTIVAVIVVVIITAVTASIATKRYYSSDPNPSAELINLCVGKGGIVTVYSDGKSSCTFINK